MGPKSENVETVLVFKRFVDESRSIRGPLSVHCRSTPGLARCSDMLRGEDKGGVQNSSKKKNKEEKQKR